MYMTLRINRVTTDAYRCLCRDLGAEYKLEFIELTRIAELRMKLLRYTEKWTKPTDDIHSPFWDYTKEQHDDCLRLWEDINSMYRFDTGYLPFFFAHHAKSFAVLYQLVSAPLKIMSDDITDEQEEQYYERLLQNEESCASFTMDRSNPIHRVARQLSLTASTHLDLGWTSVQPRMRDGSGAVYDGSTLDRKRSIDRLSTAYLSRYPFDMWFANANLCLELMDKVDVVDEFDACRCLLVPKDWKGPRGVFISHKESMKVQLAQLSVLVESMSKTWMRRSYTFESQLGNQERALIGSYSGQYATLDLSDASDRIPLDLVEWLFPDHVFRDLCSVRSRFLQIGSLKLPMSMFAPMGDGRTFPVLTWTCITYAVAAVLLADDPSYAYRKIPMAKIIDAASRVRVFGDDLIVESKYYDLVCHALEISNLKVNSAKSYRRGSFRESCGLDAFAGNDVTPFRMRVLLDRQTCLASLIASHNNAFIRGLRLYAAHLESYIQTRWHHKVAYTSDSICNPNMLLSNEPARKNLRLKHRVSCLHYVEVACVVPAVPSRDPADLDARWHLNDWLFKATNRVLTTEMSSIRGEWSRGDKSEHDIAKEFVSLRQTWAAPVIRRRNKV